jgi:hypothetical protein
MAILLASEGGVSNVVSFFAELRDVGCALRPKEIRPLTERRLFFTLNFGYMGFTIRCIRWGGTHV